MLVYLCLLSVSVAFFPSVQRFLTCRRRPWRSPQQTRDVDWYDAGPLGQRLLFAGSDNKPHCVAHIGVVTKRNNKFRSLQNLGPVRVVNDSCCKVTFQSGDFSYCRYK